MLSRPPGVDQGKQDNTDIVLLPPRMFIATTTTQDDMLKSKVKEAQQKQKGEMELWCDTQGVRKLPEGYAKRVETSSAIRISTETRANGPVPQHTYSGLPRKRQYPCPSIPTLLVAMDEYLDRMIHCGMCPLSTKQNPHHQEENSTVSYPRRPLDVPIQCHCTRSHHAVSQGKQTQCNSHHSRSRVLESSHISPMQYNNHWRRGSPSISSTFVPMVQSPI